ncbi:MAG TPA: YlxR family protein [Streptosporangiaceae bacterium]
MRRHCKLEDRNGQAVPLPSSPVSPTRTCVGCGARTAKSEMLRLVAVGNDIVPDVVARLPGRGAYLHRSQECWERAQRRKALTRALRAPGASPAGEIAGFLASDGGRG